MFTIPRPLNHKTFIEIQFLENNFFPEYFFGKTFFQEFENTLKMRSLAANRTSLRQKMTEISILMSRPFWRVFWPPIFNYLSYWYKIWCKYGPNNFTNASIKTIVITRRYLKWKIFIWKFWKIYKIFFWPMKELM